LKILQIIRNRKSGILQLFIHVFFLIVFFPGCSTKKNTATTRAYHNLTARYNVYFNGHESLKNSLRQVQKSYLDDYSKILPVFRYEDKSVSTMMASDMDLAIKKCAKAIKTHSITAKPKTDAKKPDKYDKEFLAKQEYCKLIDDAYLLMGKAHFLKREFETALQTFMLITNKYKSESSVDGAWLWIAKTYAETGEYQNADNTIRELKKNKKLYKDFYVEMDLIRASMSLKQKDFNNASIYLVSAIKNYKGKKEKARLTFILAQVYQYDNKYKLAAENYNKVIKLNPDYAMSFAAVIGLAEMYGRSGGNSDDLKKQLLKMLNDEKNIDFLDQIYYALGKIELNEKNDYEAIEYFNLSAQSKSSNKSQKVKTFGALAELYSNYKFYNLAEAYYDSTIISIDKSEEAYESTKMQLEYLKDLNHNLYTFVKEDSVQFIAKLPEKERNEIIDNIIKKIVEKEQQNLVASNNSDFDPYLMDNDYNENTRITEAGKFYFYNPTALSIGQTDFRKKWGERKLEDNWRRSNKQAAFDNQEIATNTDSSKIKNGEGKTKISDKKSREYYLQDIPLNAEKLAESNKRIEEALFVSGEIYYKNLNEIVLAVQQFEKLLIRFPESEFRFQTLKYLYTISNTTLNYAAAERYKQLIINDFPDNPFAKLLSDPTYVEMLEKKQTEMENVYQVAYNNFKNKEYYQTIENCNEAENKYPNSELLAGFLYLKALSFGETGNKLKLKENLELLIKEYPKSEQAKAAAPTLDLIINKKFEKEPYSLNRDTLHFYFLLFPKDRFDVNKLKFKFIKLNAESFTQTDFTVSIQSFDDDSDFILIHPFKNSIDAMNYFKTVITKNLLEDIQKNKPVHFIISAGNYSTFIKNKEIEKYTKFFDANYLVN